ncbi:hypothetical protein GCM10008940_02560 [Microbulbifer agarilyticus]
MLRNCPVGADYISECAGIKAGSQIGNSIGNSIGNMGGKKWSKTKCVAATCPFNQKGDI